MLTGFMDIVAGIAGAVLPVLEVYDSLAWPLYADGERPCPGLPGPDVELAGHLHLAALQTWPTGVYTVRPAVL